MTELTNDQLLKILQTVVEQMRAEVDRNMTLSRLLLLIKTAQQPGMQQSDAPKQIKGCSSAALSRYVLNWGDDGPGFMQQRPDPAFRKRFQLFLTPAGHQFIGRLTASVNESLNGFAGSRS